MSCQTLTAGLAPNARPQGSLTANGRPQSPGLCRSFDFSQPAPGSGNIVTFGDDDMVTFSGDQLEVF